MNKESNGPSKLLCFFIIFAWSHSTIILIFFRALNGHIYLATLMGPDLELEKEWPVDWVTAVLQSNFRLRQICHR